MRLACLFSGGKDSTFAVHLAKQAGHEVSILVAMEPQNTESFLFHVPNVKWTSLQARAMNIPLLLVPTTGKKSREMVDLKDVLRDLKKNTRIEGVVTGAVFSTYQASRIQKICHELDLYCFNPLWQNSPKAHWHELLVSGFEIVLVSVAAQGLEKGWLGKLIDEHALHELVALEKKFGVSSIGEGGEYESFVVNAPLFEKKISVVKYSDEWKGLQGTRHIVESQLMDKIQKSPVRKKSSPVSKKSHLKKTTPSSRRAK